METITIKSRSYRFGRLYAGIVAAIRKRYPAEVLESMEEAAFLEIINKELLKRDLSPLEHSEPQNNQ